MVLCQRSVSLVPNLLNGARSGLATGQVFATGIAKAIADAKKHAGALGSLPFLNPLTS